MTEATISEEVSETKSEDVASLKKDIESLRIKVAAATIAGLLFGSGGAFGIFTYFVEKPLKDEHESLKAKISHAQLDKMDLEQTVTSYEKQLGVLQKQFKNAESQKSSQVNSLQKQLEFKNKQYLQALEILERERQKKRILGGGWFSR